ncbi:MAG: hypothetical protein LKK26_06565 [Solobacterium sp.]|jgi:hypothetical protein|nr:hypothetical protein [Solobacterium sp.]
MGNELQKPGQTGLQLKGNPSFVANGDNNMQVGYIQQQTNYYTGMYGMGYMPAIVNSEYYNLIVADQNALDGMVVIPKRYALNDFTDDPIREIFAKPELAAADEIKKLPSLFLIRNRNGRHSDPGQYAAVGYVMDIKMKGDSIIIQYSTTQQILQERLNELEEELCLKSAPERNELDCVHWAIKKVNLIQVIQEQNLFQVMTR